MRSQLLIPFMLVLFVACQSSQSQKEQLPVKVGAEVLIDKHLDELKGKRIGLVMNPTARVDGTHMLDTLISLEVNVTALFAPEHGFRGQAGAGEVIEDGIDQQTGLPVFSLYGENRKPTPQMLDNVDLLLFDMQDVGARFYTYNATLGLVIEAAAESGLPVWVLDRPNPAGGDYVAGWMLDEKYKSFVGAYPIPMVHGMTLGELARMMIGKRWIEFDEKPELRVISLENWDRSMKWPETGLDWFPPSPNLPTFEHAYVYLGTVLFEGTNISEGRGTDDPFLIIGSPNTNLSDEQLDKLRKKFPSVEIENTVFTPRSIPGKALHPKLEGKKCFGVKLSVKNYNELKPVSFGVRLLKLMLESTAESQTKDFIFKLAGSEAVTNYTLNWHDNIEKFRKQRKKYLIY